MIQTVITSLIRTVAGYLAAWLLTLKLAGPILDLFHVNTATAKERLVAAFVVVLGTVWYFVVRLLEERWPAFGSLLGVPSRPRYAPLSGDGKATDTSSLPLTITTSSTTGTSGTAPIILTDDPTPTAGDQAATTV